MKEVHKFTSLLFGLLLIYSAILQAQDVKIGSGVTYGTEIKSIGVEGVAVAGFGTLRGAADIKIFLPDTHGAIEHSSYRELNANAHYIFLSPSPAVIYGLAGLNYTDRKITITGLSESGSKIGMNLGGGAELDIGGPSLYAELKYVIGKYDQLNFSGGIRFGF